MDSILHECVTLSTFALLSVNSAKGLKGRDKNEMLRFAQHDMCYGT